MTIGLVLIFIGIQLTLVKSVVLTPTANQFLQEEFPQNNQPMISPGESPGKGFLGGLFGGSGPGKTDHQPGQTWPYYQSGSSQPGSAAAASSAPAFQNSSWQTPGTNPAPLGTIQPGKRMVPPRWMKWPPIFVGIVFFLHGAALRP